MIRFVRLSVVFFTLIGVVCSGFSQHRNAFDEFAKNEQKILSILNSEIKRTQLDLALFLIYKNGECKYGRVITDKHLDINKTTLPLGKTSLALVSLMALNMQECGLVNVNESVSEKFSKFRTTKGNVRGATLQHLFSQTAGVPYLADKIPLESSVDEFFDMLAQMDFSVAGSVYYPSISSQAIAGYTLAYLHDSNAKDLKKAFVRACRKYLFNPLKIDVVKFRNFNKWSFTTNAFALNFQGIQNWLECETSLKPSISTASAVRYRRSNFTVNSVCSSGWKKLEKAPFDAVYTSDSNNMTVVYKAGQDTLAVSLFIKKSNKTSDNFSFSNFFKNINLLLTDKLN